MPITETEPGGVIFAGENSFIRLSRDGGETFHEPRGVSPCRRFSFGTEARTRVTMPW